MPNMLEDGFIEQAQFVHQVALLPTNPDYNLQGAVANAVTTAALAGLFTTTVNVAAYTNSLVQILMQRLVNMGYTTSLSSNTLTVNW